MRVVIGVGFPVAEDEEGSVEGEVEGMKGANCMLYPFISRMSR